MAESSSSELAPVTSSPYLPLRVWPPLLLVGLMFFFRWLPTLWQNGPSMLWMSAAMGPAVCGILILLWWLVASRATGKERVVGLVGCIAAAVLAVSLADKSMMGPAVLVLTVPMGTALFAMGAAIFGRKLALKRTFMAILFAACGFGFSALLQNDGMWGDFALGLDWRWNETPEDQLLARIAAKENSASESGASSSQSNSRTQRLSMLQNSEWPGFRGADRMSRQRGVTFSSDWKSNPPEQLWKVKVGPGWSSFSVAGDLLFTQEQRGPEECVICYDAQTGNEVWSQHIESRFEEAIGGPGPRATPTLDNRAGEVDAENNNPALYAMGAEGFLLRLDAANGDIVWKTDLREVASRAPPTWGFSSSPLVVGSVVIVHAGGPDDKGILGFDTTSGELVWSVASGDHSYSSPHLYTNGQEQLVLVTTNDGLNVVDPATGSAKLNYTWKHGDYRVLQPQVVNDDTILIPTGMGTGTRSIRLTSNEGALAAEELWTTLALKSDYNDFVVYQGHAYGFDGLIFTCVDLKDGKRQWKRGRYGKGQVLLLEDSGLLLVASERGDVVLLKADPSQHQELAKIKALDGKTWNHPVVVGDRLFIRNAQEAACYRLPVAQPSL